MRVVWACVGLALWSAIAGACGGGDDSQGTASPGSGGSSTSNAGGSGAGTSGNSAGNAGQGVAGTSGSNGASGNTGTSGGSGASGSGGNGIGGADASSGNGGTGGGGGAGGSSGTGTGGTPSDAGAGSDAGNASSPDASDGASTNCDAGTSKVVFVSSALYTGDIGGLSGADSKCQGLANNAGLCGTFKAWLSDSTQSAASRLTNATSDYVLPNGQLVAHGWAGLTSGTLQHAINRTESNGDPLTGTVSCANSAVPVWTGTLRTGAIATGGSCGGSWMSSSTSVAGVFGNVNGVNASWTEMCQLLTVCASTASIYCVEQ